MPQANNSSTPSKAVETRFFSVADLAFAISFVGYDDGFRMLKSFRPFERTTADKGSLLFTLTIDDSTRPVAKERRKRIREFETGNGTTIVTVSRMAATNTSSRTSTPRNVPCSLPTRTSLIARAPLGATS